MASMGDIGSSTAAAVAPALPPDGFDESGIGPITMGPAAEPAQSEIQPQAPVEAPNRDHLGNIDPSSGSVFGPDFPETEEPPPSVAAPTSPAPTRDPAVRERVGGARALADPRPPDASIVRERLGGKPPVDAEREAAAGPLPTLDAGLPSEADIAGAREGAGDSFLRHLQNGLRGAIGMSPREAPTTADDLARERRAGIRAGMERKGVLRGQEATASAAAARQASQDELAQSRLGLEERRTAAAEAQIPSRIAATEASTARTQAQTESAQLATQFSRATREERQSAESQLSRGYQQAIDATLRGMGATGARFREGLTSQLDQQSAEQLEPLMRRLQSAGMRTGAAGGAASPVTEGGSLAEQYVAHGISEDIAQAQAEIAALGGADSARAQQRLATRMDEATPPPPTGSVQANVAAAQGAADEIQSVIARSGRDIPGIGRLDALVPTVALSEEGRRMRALVLNLSDNYLRMVSGAAIPAHEIESFAERLGASDEPIFREQVARIQREIARRQTGSAASPATTAHRRPRTQAPAAPIVSGMVQMRNPSGAVGPVRADRVADAEAAGYTRVADGP
jgi:hypothetical protein